MGDRVLVLGATGNIGSFLVQNLQKKNAQFIGGVPASEVGKLKSMGIQGAPVDFDDPASLDHAMRGMDALFMLLPMSGQMTAWGRNVTEAAKNNDVRFILRSSIINAAPDSQYLLCNVHGKIDQMVRDSGIPYSIVHPNTFMQNFAVYHASEINHTGAFSLARGEAETSYVDVRDIAGADAEILTNPAIHEGREYTVTGPAGLTCAEVARILSTVAGRTIRYNPLEESQLAEGMRRIGMPEWSINLSLSLDQQTRDGRQVEMTDDVRALTGRAPIPFEQFARDYAQTWKTTAAA